MVLCALLPVLARVGVVLNTGQQLDLTGVLLGGLLSYAPLCVIALLPWHLVVREGKRAIANVRIRFLLRALKAAWVLAFPLVFFIGARRLPMPVLLPHLVAVATYGDRGTRGERAGSN